MWPACSCTNGLIMDFIGQRSKKIYASKALMGNQKNRAQVECKVFNGTPWENSPKRNVIEMFHVAPGSCTNGLLWIYLAKVQKEYASKALMVNQKNRHKLNARSSMVTPWENSPKKKCNWNVSCGPMFMQQMASYGFIWQRSKKKYASKALMGNQKIGTSWMQGLQWYSMRNSPKRNVIEMFSCGPMVHAQKWPLLWIYLATGLKEICIESSNRWTKKIGTSWMQGLQWYSMRNSPKRKCNWNVFHVAPGSCTKWTVMDLFGKGSKKYASKSSNGEPKKLAQDECKVFNGTPWENSPNRNVIEMFSCGPQVHAQMACYGFIWQRSKKNMHRKL